MRCLLAAALCLALPAGAHAAELIGSFTWTYPKPYFGGLSGIDLSEDGQSFVAIGDNGQVTQGTIRRENGRIVAMDIPAMTGLRRPDGETVRGRDEFDSEGITLMPGGGFCVSFERRVRVWCYEDWTGTPSQLAGHADFVDFWVNGGPEALAAGPDGALYTIPENRTGPWHSRWVYRYRDGVWERFGPLAVPGGFKPVGADIGPDGHFYVLERRVSLVRGFSARVRRFRIGPEGLAGGETLLETDLGTHDNLEGIAVWRASGGGLRITMISDDNYSRFQETEVVEYAVPEAMAPLDRAAETR